MYLFKVLQTYWKVFLWLNGIALLNFKWIKNELLSQAARFQKLSSGLRHCLQPSVWLGDRVWLSAQLWDLPPHGSHCPASPPCCPERFSTRKCVSFPEIPHLLPCPSPLSRISFLMWQSPLIFVKSAQEAPPPLSLYLCSPALTRPSLSWAVYQLPRLI